MDKIRIICVGLGSRGWWPLKISKRRNDIEIVGLVEPREEFLQKGIEFLGLPPEKAFTDLGEALKKVPCDGVIVITPPQTHSQLCLQAIEAGKHIIVEKPFTLSLRESIKVVEEAEKKNVKVVVAQNARYSRLYLTIKRILEQEIYGRASYGLFIQNEWRPGVKHVGDIFHSYLWERGIHDFDTLRSFLGDPEKISSLSFNPTWSPYKHGAGNIAWLTFKNKVVFNCFFCFASSFSSKELMIDCDKGGLTLENGKLYFQERGKQEKLEIPLDEHIASEEKIWELFTRYVLFDEEPPVSGKNNLKTISLIEALMFSSDNQVIVDFGQFSKGL